MAKRPPRRKPSFFAWDGNWPIVLKGLAALLMLAWLVQAFHKAYRAEGYDLTPRFEAARALLQGNDPYLLPTPFPLTYPLFICVLFIPLTWLPYSLENLLWFLISAWSLHYLLNAVLGSFRPGLGTRERTLTLGVLFLGALVILQNNFANGQVNIFVIALCVLGFRLLSSGRPMAAGWTLAAAIAFKLTPLVLVGYLFLRKEWKALFWTGVGILVLAWELPYLIAGPEILGYYQGYLFNYVLPSFGALTSVLPETFQFKNYLHALVPGSEGTALSVLSDLLVLAPLAWVQLRAGKALSPRREIPIFSAYLTVSLWLSPISETHHLAALFPGLALMSEYALLEDRRAPWLRFGPLAGVFLLLWAGIHHFEFFFMAIGICYVFLLVRTSQEGRTAKASPRSGTVVRKKPKAA